MAENVQLRLFTVGDLKQYFIHNKNVDLLSEQVIDHTRAYATIKNPFVTDDMAVVSAVFVDGNVAAYTYVFPDKLEKPDRLIFWNTVLFVDKKYEGRGYGFIVIGQMVEQYGDDYFDLDAVPASVENLKYAGLKVDYVEQYYLEQKKISTKSLKGKAAKHLDSIKYLVTNREKQLAGFIEEQGYSLRYVNFIDDELYKFIKENSKGDLFLRSQATFNWILSYPFMQESPIVERVEKHCAFSSVARDYSVRGVEIMKEGRIIGFFIYRKNQNELFISYLYYLHEFENEVFASVAEHLLAFKSNRFFSSNKKLVDFVDDFKLFAHTNVYKKSFSHPLSFEYSGKENIHAGDGDNFL